MEMNHSLKCIILLNPRVHIQPAPIPRRKTFINVLINKPLITQRYIERALVIDSINSFFMLNRKDDTYHHLSEECRVFIHFFRCLPPPDSFGHNRARERMTSLECLQLSLETFKVNNATSSSAQLRLTKNSTWSRIPLFHSRRCTIFRAAWDSV